MTAEREYPGGWVDDIGWVAVAGDLDGDDLATDSASEYRTSYNPAAFDPTRPVIVTRWADGTVPSAPVATEVACIAEGHWFHGPNGTEHDPDEGPCEFPAESTTTTHLADTRFTFDGCGEHLEATRHDDGSVTIANDHGAVSLPNDDAADFASWLAQVCPRHELDHLRRWKAEATAVLSEWDKVHVALGKPGRLGQSIAAASLAEAQRLTDECAAWMNGVADAVEPLGFDRHAANGPADLLPGLKMLAAQSNPVPFPGHVRPATDPPAVPLVADPALMFPTRGLNGPAK